MIIQKLNSAPTDAEYIQAFRENDNALTTQFLRENYGLFMGAIKKKYTIKIDGAYNEIYQETLVRLWEEIYEDKIEIFEGSRLINYMIGIGRKVAQEYIHEHKNLIHTIQKAEEDKEDRLESEYVDMSSIDSVDQSFKPITKTPREVWEESLWGFTVDDPYEKYKKAGHTAEECAEEWNRLVDAFEKIQKQKSAPSQLPDAADYRAAIIKEVVDNMGEPCAPLLMSFYWEKKSWAIIAEELEYSGADSAKTQKSKCMGKLKALVTNRMKEVEL